MGGSGRIRFASLPMLLAAAGCGGERMEALAGRALGTSYSIQYIKGPGQPPPAVLAREVAALLEGVEAEASLRRPDSALSRLNAHRGAEAFPLPPGLTEVLGLALRVAERTGGAFDPTVAPLVAAWGFGPGPPPAGGVRLETLRAGVGWRRLRLDPGAGTVVKAGPEVACDLGGIAKGWAVDRVAELLGRREVARFLVELGGEARAAGPGPGGRPWRLGIEDPGGGVVRVLPLAGLAAATSGRGRQERPGDAPGSISHLIDPRTGRPVGEGLAAVTVLASTAAEADALATALMVLGPVAGPLWAEREGVAALFLGRSPGGPAVETVTAAFAALAGPPPQPATTDR